MLSVPVSVTNQLGLHARAAAKIVNAVKGLESSVTLRRSDGATAAGGSILDILAMSVSVGSRVELIVDGPDEERAVEVLTTLFAERFGESS